MKPETELWMKWADDDMRMAKAAVELEIWSQCLFHCQQAIEKVLKGRLVEGDIPFQKIHDLPDLARLADLNLSEDQLQLIARLSEHYIPSRYGDASLEISDEAAQEYYRRTKDMYSWLLQQLN